jgi:hypothetical protein
VIEPPAQGRERGVDGRRRECPRGG